MGPLSTKLPLNQPRGSEHLRERQPNVRIRLVITIPTILFLFTLATGLLTMNLTKIGLLPQIGRSVWKTQVKAIFPVEVWVVLFGLLAGGAGLLLAYGITRPLKKLYSETEELLSEDLYLHPSPITAANEVTAAGTFLKHTCNALNRHIQDQLNAIPEGILSLDTQGGILSIKNLEEIKQVRDEIRRVEQSISLGAISAELAHELRNPLGSIQGCAQLLMRGMGSDDKYRPPVETILKEVERLSRLSQDFLTFARSNEIEPQICSVRHLIKEAITIAQAPFSHKKVAVNTHFQEPEGEDQIPVDKGKMSQALVNVITNAFQSTTDGGEVYISCGKRRGKMRISIANTGSFISPERRQKVFVPFYTTRPGAAGLGLAIVQRIVTAHNGTVELESSEDKGTVFVFEIPIYGLAT